MELIRIPTKTPGPRKDALGTAAAAEDVKWRESLIVAVGVTAFCAVLFPYGLNLPFQLWPRFW